jgi:hypothetical protein
MDRLMRFAVLLGALLAGGGVFYHYVFFLPGVERVKQEQVAQNKRDAEAKERQRQLTYVSCKVSAQKAYDLDWANACFTVFKEQKVSLEACLKDKLIMGNEFLGRSHCESTYSGASPSLSCSLPLARADSLNHDLKEAQDKCLSEAKTGL